jgi:rod shape-determining protein MreD
LARRVVFTAGIIVICAALQFSVVHHLAVRGVAPDLLLVVTVSIGLLSGPRAGMATGFGGGLLEGALLGAWIGVYAGAKTVAGYFAGETGRRVFAENLLVIVGAVAVLTLVHEAIYDVFARPAGLWPMITYAIARAAYNGGLAVVVGAGLRRARRLLPPEEVGA